MQWIQQNWYFSIQDILLYFTITEFQKSIPSKFSQIVYSASFWVCHFEPSILNQHLLDSTENVHRQNSMYFSDAKNSKNFIILNFESIQRAHMNSTFAAIHECILCTYAYANEQRCLKRSSSVLYVSAAQIQLPYFATLTLLVAVWLTARVSWCCMAHNTHASHVENRPEAKANQITAGTRNSSAHSSQ